MFKQADLDQFKALLMSLRARLRGDVEHLTDGAFEGGDSGRSPTHMADLGTDAFEQDFSLRFAESDQEVLAEITAALNRIDSGTYGVCESCQEEGKAPSRSGIPKTRLKAIPYARNCVACEEKREQLMY